MNLELQKTVPLTIVKGDKSISAYNRKGLAHYFVPALPNKCHSPNFDTMEWDKVKLLQDLKQAELTSESIIRSACARQHGIVSKNDGKM